MKIGQLIKILQGCNPNAELLIPCGDGSLTNEFSVDAVRVRVASTDPWVVAAIPKEGLWSRGENTIWTPVADTGLRPLTEAQQAHFNAAVVEREKDCSIGARKVCKACGKMDIPLDGDGRCSACILMAHGVRISGESARRPFTEAEFAEVKADRAQDSGVGNKKICRLCHKQQGPLDDDGLCPWCIPTPHFCYNCNKEVKYTYDLSEDEGYCKDCVRLLKENTA